jgi:hypothetical protein
MHAERLAKRGIWDVIWAQVGADLEGAQTGVGIFTTKGRSGGCDVGSDGWGSRGIASSALGSAQRVSVRDARRHERGRHRRRFLSFFLIGPSEGMGE